MLSTEHKVTLRKQAIEARKAQAKRGARKELGAGHLGRWTVRSRDAY